MFNKNIVQPSLFDWSPEPTKHCNRCNRALPLTQFCVDRKKKSGLRNYCKECEKKRVASYNREHHEERIAYARERYYSDVEQSRRKWRENAQRNIDRSRQIRRNSQRRYRNNHPDAVRLRNRMNYKKNTNHPDMVMLHQKQQGRCYYCDIVLGDDYQTDHVISLLRGGSNAMENIVLCCPTCNRSKGVKMPHEWQLSAR